MAGASLPGPTCGLTRPAGSVRDGTLMLQPAPLPGSAQSGRQAGLTHLQEAIDQLQVAANQFARVAIKEAGVRQAYLREIGEMSRKLLREVEQGVISPKQGAEVAQQLRNEIMAASRLRSTPVGRAWAEQLKRDGKALDALLDHYARKHFQRAFSELSSVAQRNAVFLEVVKAAGRDRSWVAPVLSRAAKVGRGLVVVSLAFSVYEVATAEDKAQVAGREASALGAGMLGGMAGGAVAGLACGPGAPVCVAAIVFASGALAAWGGSEGFEWLRSGE